MASYSSSFTVTISLLPIFLLLLSITTTTAQLPFRCTTTTNPTCNALIDYSSPNTTTYSSILRLFEIRNLRTLLGANNLPLSTPANTTIPASQTLRIPFPCRCSNGTGISNRRPNYTVVAGDGLFHIAAEVFSNLVTYQQIQAVNNISDANLIEVGQRLWIPLPCSCDDVDGQQVVHYGHVVANGSSVEAIGARFNVSQDTILRVNNLTATQAQQIQAGVVLDVPLRACSSAISNTSLDYPLLVPNDTYVFTAGNCVRCRCDATLSWGLQCESYQFNSSCSPVQCEGASLFLGNSTSPAGCGSNICAYAGFARNRTIMTTVTTATCPVPTDNGSSGIKLQHSSILLIAIHMMLLYVSLLK